MRRGILVLLAVLLSCAAAAPPAASQAMQVPPAVQTLANNVWHAPCGGSWTVEVGYPDTDLVPHDWSWFGYDAGCSIYLNPRYGPWKPGRRLCHVVLHEVGHAAGAGHNRNPKSIMYDGYDGTDNVDPRCARLYPSPHADKLLDAGRNRR